METKICIECNEEKETHNFALEGKSGKVRRNKCRSCVRLWNALPAEVRKEIKINKRNQLINKNNKRCVTCNQTKERIDFYVSTHNIDNMSAECKNCDDNRSKQRRAELRINKINGNTISASTKKCRTCKQELAICMFSSNVSMTDGYDSQCSPCRQSQWRSNTTPKTRISYLLSRLRTKCTKGDIEFDLTVDDLIIPDRCPILDIPLVFGNDNSTCTGPTDNSPSVDRIDPSKGYTKDNIVVVSQRANRIKNNATIQELQLLYQYYSNLTLT